MPQLIASSTDAASAEFALTDGQTTQLALNVATEDVPRTAAAQLQYKNSAGTFTNIPGGRLTAEVPAQLVAGPGAFRVTKQASPIAFGVDRT